MALKGATRSSKSIGRGRAICEYIEIMQILPGSSDNALLINASRVICNMTTSASSGCSMHALNAA